MIQPLLKPSKLARLALKADRSLQRRATKRAAKQAQVKAEAEVRRQVYERDGHACRACGKTVVLRSDNPFLVAHCHHVEFRSQGGADAPFNRLTIDVVCHEQVHQRLLHITSDGDAGQPVAFRLVDRTGATRRQWRG